MADTKESVLLVTITTSSEDPTKCEIRPPFVARPGETVTFKFEEPGAMITFDGFSPAGPPVDPPAGPLRKSPFDDRVFKPGEKVVRKDAGRGRYEYSVSWPNAGGGVGNGSGNGTGEVIGR